MSKKNRSKRVAIKGGESCPKYSRPMQRYGHAKNWRPRLGHYYFRYWDTCRACAHMQLYPEAKVDNQPIVETESNLPDPQAVISLAKRRAECGRALEAIYSMNVRDDAVEVLALQEAYLKAEADYQRATATLTTEELMELTGGMVA